MVTTLTFKEFLRDVKVKYAHHSGIVGIMLIRATKENSANNNFVVNCYEEWDSLTSYTDRPLYIFWAGYGCWLNPDEEGHRKIILDAYDNRENRRIYFDKYKYGSFKREIKSFWDDSTVEWGENANLLLIDCDSGKLDFKSTYVITLDDFEYYGFRSREGFCEAILRKWPDCYDVETLRSSINKVATHTDAAKGNTQSVSNSPIAVTGNNNVINVAGGPISGNQIESEEKNIKIEEKSAGIKGFFSGVLQGITVNAIWYLLGIIGAAVLSYFALK